MLLNNLLTSFESKSIGLQTLYFIVAQELCMIRKRTAILGTVAEYRIEHSVNAVHHLMHPFHST